MLERWKVESRNDVPFTEKIYVKSQACSSLDLPFVEHATDYLAGSRTREQTLKEIGMPATCGL